MARREKEFYIQRARERYEKPGTPSVDVIDIVEHDPNGPKEPTIVIPPNPQVSLGTNPGGWVMAWIFIPDDYPDERK
jgi:hypothetical protein